MRYLKKYKMSDNFSDMFMESDGEYLTGLWFVDSKDSLEHSYEHIEKFANI